jgi:hypothetical protein
MSTPSATVVAGNVLAGPAAMFIGSLDASGNVVGAPAASAVNVAPAASAWSNVGGTSGGVTVITNQTMFSMYVDQIPDRVGVRMTQRDVLIRTNMAEGTLINMARAMNVAESAITVGDGYRQFALPFGQAAFFPHERAILMDGWAPVAANAAMRRRVLLRRVVSIENIEAGYTKDGLFVIPVTFGALYVNDTDSPVTFTDEDSTAEA